VVSSGKLYAPRRAREGDWNANQENRASFCGWYVRLFIGTGSARRHGAGRELTQLGLSPQDRLEQAAWIALAGELWCLLWAYLKYIQAATANKTIVKIQRDESLIPVFLAINLS
jgi:hypothetical protein